MITGFMPILGENPKILILGSMPSETSLEKQQYYGHPRNAFWPIMLSIFLPNTNNANLDYEQRKKLLMDHRIAVWDVLQSCQREGSLDTAIAMDSIQANNFMDFFKLNSAIKTVVFNGAKAESIYQKNVLQEVSNQFSDIKYIRLPSTSPAHASLTLQQKTEIWQNALNPPQ